MEKPETSYKGCMINSAWSRSLIVFNENMFIFASRIKCVKKPRIMRALVPTSKTNTKHKKKPVGFQTFLAFFNYIWRTHEFLLAEVALAILEDCLAPFIALHSHTLAGVFGDHFACPFVIIPRPEPHKHTKKT